MGCISNAFDSTTQKKQQTAACEIRTVAPILDPADSGGSLQKPRLRQRMRAARQSTTLSPLPCPNASTETPTLLTPDLAHSRAFCLLLSLGHRPYCPRHFGSAGSKTRNVSCMPLCVPKAGSWGFLVFSAGSNAGPGAFIRLGHASCRSRDGR